MKRTAAAVVNLLVACAAFAASRGVTGLAKNPVGYYRRSTRRSSVCASE